MAIGPTEEEKTQEAPREDTPAARVYICDLCGFVMLDSHCKLTCLRCGYMRDCSDP